MSSTRAAHPPRRTALPVAASPKAAPAGGFDAITYLQRTAGNRAVTALIHRTATASVQRDGDGSAALSASYQSSVSTGNWRKAATDLNGFNETDIQTRVAALNHDQLIQLDAAARHALPGSNRLPGYIAAHDAEANRVGFLTFQFESAVVARDFDGAGDILNAFNDADILTKAALLSDHDRDKMISAATDRNIGGGRLATLLRAAGSHSDAIDVKEQVGGNEYSSDAGYKYHLTPDAIVVDVGMNFHPDHGVTTPVTTWFQDIKTIWNHYSAFNADDQTEHKQIDFRPYVGGDHDIDVSQGDRQSRANAGHYFINGQNMQTTVPHEFGHLIGLEDEYERDANDYTRVTGQAPAASTTPAATTEPVARALHDALFGSEHRLEWHRTAERRRMAAVNAVCANAGISPGYNWHRSQLSADVAATYHRLYQVELSHDFMKQVDTDNKEFDDWREKVLGTFQLTNTSVMGDKTFGHDHPVEPRHVRRFAGYVQQMLGRGHWSPRQDH